MVEKRYLTVAEPASASFEISGSEFIGYVSPAASIEEAEAFLAEIEAAHPDATHNVPAYRVRAEPFREYQNDDGEPSGSAGKPALNVLQGRDLENVACVVTRYYGGTNLGIGGLVRAYSRAVNEVVEAAGIEEVRPHVRIEIVVGYDDSGTVRGIVESAASEFEANYDERVQFLARVPTAEAAAFRDRVLSATGGRAEIG